MSAKYLLPCQCGRTLTVEVGQAGQTLACSCGQTVEVPSMRAIRDLTPAEPESAADGAPAKTWSRTQGLLFSAGLLVALLGFGAAGWFLLARLSLDTSITAEAQHEFDEQQIDYMGAADAWEAWEHLQKSGLTSEYEPAFVVVEKAALWQTRLITAGAIIGLCGAGLAISAFFVRGKPS